MPSHILRIIKKENSIQELDDHSVAAIKSLNIQKQDCLYLLMVHAFYVKLESSCCKSYSMILLGLIDREFDSTDWNSSRTLFCKIFQLNPKPIWRVGFYVFSKYKRENPSHILGYSFCCVCESFVRSKYICLHTYLGLSRRRIRFKNLTIIQLMW